MATLTHAAAVTYLLSLSDKLGADYTAALLVVINAGAPTVDGAVRITKTRPTMMDVVESLLRENRDEEFTPEMLYERWPLGVSKPRLGSRRTAISKRARSGSRFNIRKTRWGHYVYGAPR